ncbi:MAG TPA: hypothetical protein IGS17_08205 [Oscillatoriales cyanobacterium M59_W2019_021]|nr:hypothetical protein [Oscillatoriales cyanobacterium M4454_W2019_049]HIK50889.1 hypothetical protein [Oscillatoriales cyanobacterium M59_W2019_021]
MGDSTNGRSIANPGYSNSVLDRSPSRKKKWMAILGTGQELPIRSANILPSRAKPHR